MTTQEILNQETTKTAKIQQLLALGLSRTEVTEMIAEHYQDRANYGFVQNVFAKMRAEKEPKNSKKTSLIITETYTKSDVPLITGNETSPSKIILLN